MKLLQSRSNLQCNTYECISVFVSVHVKDIPRLQVSPHLTRTVNVHLGGMENLTLTSVTRLDVRLFFAALILYVL